jgi:hypothetical protein
MSNVILFQVPAIPGVAYNHTKYGDLTIHVNKKDIIKLRDRFLRAAEQLTALEVEYLEFQKAAEARKFEIPPTPAQILEQRLADVRLQQHVPRQNPFTITRGHVEEDDGELGPPPASI